MADEGRPIEAVIVQGVNRRPHLFWQRGPGSVEGDHAVSLGEPRLKVPPREIAGGETVQQTDVDGEPYSLDRAQYGAAGLAPGAPPLLGSTPWNELVSAASLMSYGVMPEPALLNLFASELPKKATAAMQMMAMKATSSAYSTRAAPSSPLTYRARKYGTTCWRQYKARLTAFSMPPWCIRRLDGISPVTTLRHGGWRR